MNAFYIFITIASVKRFQLLFIDLSLFHVYSILLTLSSFLFNLHISSSSSVTISLHYTMKNQNCYLYKVNIALLFENNQLEVKQSDFNLNIFHLLFKNSFVNFISTFMEISDKKQKNNEWKKEENKLKISRVHPMTIWTHCWPDLDSGFDEKKDSPFQGKCWEKKKMFQISNFFFVSFPGNEKGSNSHFGPFVNLFLVSFSFLFLPSFFILIFIFTLILFRVTCERIWVSLLGMLTFVLYSEMVTEEEKKLLP